MIDKIYMFKDDEEDSGNSNDNNDRVRDNENTPQDRSENLDTETK